VIAVLEKYLNESDKKTASLVYLRGRRRVGKSTVLGNIQKNYFQNCFLFTGRKDEGTQEIKSRLTHDWDAFNQEQFLSLITPKKLDWNIVFKKIAERAAKTSTVLILDEIQWIAKSGSGFIGALKEAWLYLERLPNLKVIICGSSNKFFLQNTGGEEKILRGIKTHSDIWLHELSLTEVYKNYTHQGWTKQQVLSSYMYFGGVPYYWNQLKTEKGFIQSINEAVFCEGSIFISEIDEILELEFNTAGVEKVKRILAVVTSQGKTLSGLVRDSGIPSSTLSDQVDKLVNYGILTEKKPVFEKQNKIRSGVQFVIKDFFLNMYFQVLKSKVRLIKNNHESRLIFPTVFNMNESLFIPNYTGEAFERLIQRILEDNFERKEPIFTKLNLKNVDYEMGSHWDEKCQIDRVLLNTSDRVHRFIECKWTQSQEVIDKTIRSFSDRVSHLPANHQKVLVTTEVPWKGTVELAKKHQVCLVTFSDLVEN
jgi:predicted AAA+ superfamily ATPase